MATNANQIKTYKRLKQTHQFKNGIQKKNIIDIDNKDIIKCAWHERKESITRNKQGCADQSLVDANEDNIITKRKFITSLD